MTNLTEIEMRLGQLIDRFNAGLPQEQVTDMKELVAAGEPGVAFENYCAQLQEYEITVPAFVLDELEQLGRAMGIQETYWMELRR